MKNMQYIFFVLIFSLNVILGNDSYRSNNLKLKKIFEIVCGKRPFNMGAGKGTICLPAINFDFNSKGEIIINDGWGQKIIILDSFWNYKNSFKINTYLHTNMAIDCNDNIYIWNPDFSKKYSESGKLLKVEKIREINIKNAIENSTTAPSFVDIICNDKLGRLIDSLYWRGTAISIERKKKYLNILLINKKRLYIRKYYYNSNFFKEINLKLPKYEYFYEPDDEINVWHVFRLNNYPFEINFYHFFNEYFMFFIELEKYYVLISDAADPNLLVFDKKGDYLFYYNLFENLKKFNINIFDSIEEFPFILRSFNDKGYLMVRTKNGVMFFELNF
ncbi:hypothetical protein ACX8XN_08445 [Calditrichota bacterium GD2]